MKGLVKENAKSLVGRAVMGKHGGKEGKF